VVGLAKCQGRRNFTGMPWVVAISLPESVILAPTVSLRNRTIICGVCCWVALTLVILVIATQIVSPLTRTSEVAMGLLEVGLENDGDGSCDTTPRGIQECVNAQESMLRKLWMRDEVYVLCKMVRVLARTFAQQQQLAQSLEQRVAGKFPSNPSSFILTIYTDRTNHLQREITFREKIQASAEEARLSAEAAEAAKSRFLANMSHGMMNEMARSEIGRKEERRKRKRTNKLLLLTYFSYRNQDTSMLSLPCLVSSLSQFPLLLLFRFSLSSFFSSLSKR
jgi:hypothetical protein